MKELSNALISKISNLTEEEKIYVVQTLAQSWYKKILPLELNERTSKETPILSACLQVIYNYKDYTSQGIDIIFETAIKDL